MKTLWSIIRLPLYFLVLTGGEARACPDIDGVLDVNCDGQLIVVAFGDSITYGITYKHQRDSGQGYPGRLHVIASDTAVHNLGIPGERSSTGRTRAARELPQLVGADYVIVLEGVNDYFVSGHSAAGTKANVLSIVRSGQQTGAIALLSNLSAVKRSYQKPWVASVNSALRPYRNIDFYSLGEGIIGRDGLHPTSPGYQLMSEHVLVELKDASARNRPIDTDGDGLYDWEEIRAGTSSVNPDSDGDGLRDGQEVWTYHSSPLSLDSDADGIGDYAEVQRGSNPADSRPTAPQLTNLEIITP